MSYQVLARKWRPQAFSDVVGQEHVLTALANGLSLGRIHHAYLFSGTRGVGKTTIARLLAKGLNCEKGITVSPCGVCENCKEIEQGRFVDLIEIDAASRTKVEDTRELLDNVQYAPARGRFKVYLIDEVHMLSRHSFNALLKTLEEPPAHVKFLLATTDPQKLPVTILSRCLQFHLKALDVTQIRGQLERVLQAEQISAEVRALQLIARAADGSMRDALSLTDQAIAMGQGQITTDSVSAMLGTLDDDQPLALVEALARVDGPQVMSLLNQVAARGIEWDALLVEMLRLLHQVAMVQLLPSALGDDYALYEQRLRELARSVPPDDIQLYYQMLLVGRKELPLAPDPRMGVEMTLLRALAFNPRDALTLPEQPQIAPVAAAVPTPATAATVAPDMPPPVAESDQQETPPSATSALPDTTSHLLQARTQLRQQGGSKTKKSEPARPAERPVNRVLERFAAVGEKKLPSAASAVAAPVKKEAYRWKAQQTEQKVAEPVATPNALRLALEHEKTPEMTAKLAEEAKQRNSWAAEIDQLRLPKLVQQLALNAWKESAGQDVCLHLRSAQRHLNSSSAQAALQDALSQMAGAPVALTVTEDDDPSVLTPREWRQKIYDEKLAQARQSILADTRIQTLCQYFDAELDEESIRPV